MKTPNRFMAAAACTALVGAVTMVALGRGDNPAVAQPVEASPGRPSLTVAVAMLQPATIPLRVAANGNVMAWQEAVFGAEANGLRLIDVNVNVGDRVRRGQLLASFSPETVEAELLQGRAAVAEADVALAEAAGNARRARSLQETGALSAQQIQQYLLAERSAQARLDAARAVERSRQLRLGQTRLLAPDDGVISARSATVGAVVPAGQELFRLIRGGRLEWRAEVAGSDLAKIRPGQKVMVTPSGGAVIEGRVRMLSPSVDVQTRNGLVYVDLPASETARSGMFARGEFEIGSSRAMTLPQSAVQQRDGFSYVMRVGPDSRVDRVRVTPGRRADHRIEIVAGLGAGDRVVVTGGAFLGDGDRVRVSDAPETSPPPPPARRLTSIRAEGTS